MSLDAPTALWARGGEGWREARQVPAAPWETPHPQEERQCQVGGLGSQMVGLEEELCVWVLIFKTYYCNSSQ